MSIDEIEAEALKLDPQARARLAKKLLESLETRRTSASGRMKLTGAMPTGTRRQVPPVQPLMCFGTLGPSSNEWARSSSTGSRIEN